MDQEMRDVVLGADFFSLEIDLDYEFDAARYFDLGREETDAEAREAELWFEIAGSYPPSPFTAGLNMGKYVLQETVNTLPKLKLTENTNCIIPDIDTASAEEFFVLTEGCKGWPYQNCIPQKAPNDVKCPTRSPFTSSSTLMRPTLSQLSKQNRPREVKKACHSANRSQKHLAQKSERSFESPSDSGGQAAKRQKLEGGHLKVQVAVVKQHTDLMHKVSQKNKMAADLYSQPSKLRLTIPREPELETARRAQRRVQRLRSDNYRSDEEALQVQPIFRAKPLNRKVLEAPSLPIPETRTPWLPEFQVFDLKTNVRDVHRSSTASYSSTSKNTCSAVKDIEAGKRKFECHVLGPSSLQKDERKWDKCESILPVFKAQPLDKKVLSSKGDFGVFRRTEKEATVPTEFNLSTNRKCKQDPPTELFNKLSLCSETRQVPSQSKLLWDSYGITQAGSKENMLGSVRDGYKFKQINCDPRCNGNAAPIRAVMRDLSKGNNFSSCGGHPCEPQCAKTWNATDRLCKKRCFWTHITIKYIQEQ